jgi:hypothetical protein
VFYLRLGCELESCIAKAPESPKSSTALLHWLHSTQQYPHLQSPARLGKFSRSEAHMIRPGRDARSAANVSALSAAESSNNDPCKAHNKALHNSIHLICECRYHLLVV